MPIPVNNLTYNRFRNYYQRVGPLLRDTRASAYFMLILSLLSLSFFGAFAIRPTLSTITQLQKDISDSNQVYKKLQEKNKNLLILQAEYRKIEPLLPIVYAALPNQVYVPTFLLKVRTVATLNKLQIISLQVAKSPLSEEQNNNLISPVFSLTASGTYEDINNFLIELARLDRITTFKNIGITPGGTTGVPGSLTLQLTGEIYTLFD